MKYNAFISYRHLELDMYIAKAVHKKLETFKVPRAVAEKTGKKSIHRVFRDQEELPIGSDLGDNIKKALQESEYLIVICSPGTPQSYWVQIEIDTFIQMHGREHVLAVLIEGEPDESFPKQLLSDDYGNPVEPLAADLRGASKGEIRRKMRTEIVRLAAPLLGCSYDELRQRHRERRLRRAVCATAAVAVFAVAFGCYSMYNSMMIKKNYRGKQINQSKYLADTSLSLLEDGDRITAGLIALEALPSGKNHRPYVASAQYALSESLNAYENGGYLLKDRLLKHDLPVKNMTYSYDETKIVSLDQGGNVYVWDAGTGELLIKIVPEPDSEGYAEEVLNAAVTKDNNVIIAFSGGIRSVDLEGNENWSTESEDKYISCEFDLEMEIAAGISPGIVNFINLSDGSVSGSMENTDKGSDFTHEAEFCHEHNLFAVSMLQSDDNAEKGKVSVCDLGSYKKEDYITKKSYISQMQFSDDGNLVVFSESMKDIAGYTDKKIDAVIEKIDISGHSTVWENTIKVKCFDLDAAASILKTRKYTDDGTGKQHGEVLLSVDNSVYVWDAATGNIISETGVTSGISSFLVSADSPEGYVVENNGVMDFFNLTEGKSYSDAAVDIGSDVKEVMVKNGVVAVSMPYSENIMLMKYNEGYGMKVVNEFSSSAVKMDYSSDESYYAVETFDDSLGGKYSFYSTEDDSLKEEWAVESGSSIIDSKFIGKSDYVAAASDGRLLFYNIKDKKETELRPDAEMQNAKCRFSKDNKHIIVFSDESYYAADLQKRKITGSGSIDNSISGGIISNDGKKFYLSTDDDSVLKVDIATGKSKKADIGGVGVLRESESSVSFAISPDGNLLAINCKDNNLRILDTKKMKTSEKIEFSGQNRSFICFSENNRLIMQGDTYYFRVYNTDKHKFLYIATTQNNSITRVITHKASDTVCLITTQEMLILNQKDYEPVAYVRDGLCYMPGHAYVYNESAGTVYRFPYMSMEMLIKDAKEQYGDAELTERERIRYNVD